MAAPVDPYYNSFNCFNRAFGISYAPVTGITPGTNNLLKIEYSVPIYGIFVLYIKSLNYRISKAEIARVALSSSIVGLPVVFAVDVVASLTTQVKNAINESHAKKAKE